jgi:hypothetical protein
MFNWFFGKVAGLMLLSLLMALVATARAIPLNPRQNLAPSEVEAVSIPVKEDCPQ